MLRSRLPFMYEGQNFIVFPFCFLRVRCFGCSCCYRVTHRDEFFVRRCRQCCCCCPCCCVFRCCLLCASFDVIFLVLFGSASLTSCSRSLYISSSSSSHVSHNQSGAPCCDEVSFFAIGIWNFGITHLWSLPMSIVSLASVSLLQQSCFLSVKM